MAASIDHYVEEHRYRVMRRREEALRLLMEYEAEHGEITQDEIDALQWDDDDGRSGS